MSRTRWVGQINVTDEWVGQINVTDEVGGADKCHGRGGWGR